MTVTLLMLHTLSHIAWKSPKSLEEQKTIGMFDIYHCYTYMCTLCCTYVYPLRGTCVLFAVHTCTPLQYMCTLCCTYVYPLTIHAYSLLYICVPPYNTCVHFVVHMCTPLQYMRTLCCTYVYPFTIHAYSTVHTCTPFTYVHTFNINSSANCLRITQPRLIGAIGRKAVKIHTQPVTITFSRWKTCN